MSNFFRLLSFSSNNNNSKDASNRGIDDRGGQTSHSIHTIQEHGNNNEDRDSNSTSSSSLTSMPLSALPIYILRASNSQSTALNNAAANRLSTVMTGNNSNAQPGRPSSSRVSNTSTYDLDGIVDL